MRTYYKVDHELRSDGYGGTWKEEVRVECDPSEADLVGSLSMNGKDVHYPAIDVDLKISAVQSSTPGHYHLYIDKGMSWRQYKRLLRAMVKAGIVEPGYYKMAKRRGQTFLRTPEKPKPFDPEVVLYEDGSVWRRPPRKKAPSIPVRFRGY